MEMIQRQRTMNGLFSQFSVFSALSGLFARLGARPLTFSPGDTAGLQNMPVEADFAAIMGNLLPAGPPPIQVNDSVASVSTVIYPAALQSLFPGGRMVSATTLGSVIISPFEPAQEEKWPEDKAAVDEANAVDPGPVTYVLLPSPVQAPLPQQSGDFLSDDRKQDPLPVALVIERNEAPRIQHQNVKSNLSESSGQVLRLVMVPGSEALSAFKKDDSISSHLDQTMTRTEGMVLESVPLVLPSKPIEWLDYSTPPIQVEGSQQPPQPFPSTVIRISQGALEELAIHGTVTVDIPLDKQVVSNVGHARETGHSDTPGLVHVFIPAPVLQLLQGLEKTAQPVDQSTLTVREEWKYLSPSREDSPLPDGLTQETATNPAKPTVSMSVLLGEVATFLDGLHGEITTVKLAPNPTVIPQSLLERSTPKTIAHVSVNQESVFSPQLEPLIRVLQILPAKSTEPEVVNTVTHIPFMDSGQSSVESSHPIHLTRPVSGESFSIRDGVLVLGGIQPKARDAAIRTPIQASSSPLITPVDVSPAYLTSLTQEGSQTDTSRSKAGVSGSGLVPEAEASFVAFGSPQAKLASLKLTGITPITQSVETVSTPLREESIHTGLFVAHPSLEGTKDSTGWIKPTQGNEAVEPLPTLISKASPPSNMEVKEMDFSPGPAYGKPPHTHQLTNLESEITNQRSGSGLVIPSTTDAAEGPTTPQGSGSRAAIQVNAEPRILDQVIHAAQLRKSSTGTEIRVRLVPENLGEVYLKMNLTPEGLVAELSASRMATQEVLTKHAQQIQGMLVETGLRVDQVIVKTSGMDSSPDFKGSGSSRDPLPQEQDWNHGSSSRDRGTRDPWQRNQNPFEEKRPEGWEKYA